MYANQLFNHSSYDPNDILNTSETKGLTVYYKEKIKLGKMKYSI